MKFPSLIRLPKNKKFNVKPRHYDPIKDDIDQRVSKIKNEKRERKFINKFDNKKRFKKKFIELDIFEEFEEIIGSNLTIYIKEKKFTEGSLTIKLTSSVLRNELLFNKNNIIERINKSLKKEIVKDILLR